MRGGPPNEVGSTSAGGYREIRWGSANQVGPPMKVKSSQVNAALELPGAPAGSEGKTATARQAERAGKGRGRCIRHARCHAVLRTSWRFPFPETTSHRHVNNHPNSDFLPTPFGGAHRSLHLHRGLSAGRPASLRFVNLQPRSLREWWHIDVNQSNLNT